MTVTIGEAIISCTPAEFAELQRLGVFDKKTSDESTFQGIPVYPEVNKPYIDTGHPVCAKDFPPYLDCAKPNNKVMV